jgi:hypothetical protein
MAWHYDRMRSCQATGNNNPDTSFSAIAKKLLLFNDLQSIAAGPTQPLLHMQLRPCCFKLQHFKELFWTPESNLF